MKTLDSKVPEAITPPLNGPKHAVELAAGTLGALGGAVTGAAMGGPLGAIAGAVIGGAMGASSGWAADQHTAELAQAEAELDEDIGVTAGTIGSPNLEHPPAKIGAPSAAASGAGNALGAEPAEAAGPMPSSD